MGTLSKPYTFNAGQGISASEHNSNYDTIYNEFNGNIENVNVKAGAGIVASKINFATMPTVGATSQGKGSFSNISISDLIIVNPSTTSSVSVAVNGVQAAAQYGLKVRSNQTQTNAELVRFHQDCEYSDTTAITLASIQDGQAVNGAFVTNGTNSCLSLNAASNGAHIRFTGDPTVVTPQDGDMWFDGTVLKFRVGAATKTIDWT